MAQKISSNWRGQLTGSSILAISGAGAVNFLQGQLSNDVAKLDDDHCQWSGYHQPDGRVLAVPLVVLQEGIINLVLPTDTVNDISDRLSRYVLRAKVEFAVSECGLLGLAGPTLADQLADFTLPQPGRVTRTPGGLTLAAYGWQRVLAWGPASSIDWQKITNALSEEPESMWLLEDIREGIPRVVTAGQGLYTAQMLNLDLIDAISFNKGCYAGQEIIARTQNLGKIKRRLCRLGSETEVTGSDVCLANGDKVGEILNRQKSSTDSQLACECLAVIRLNQRQADLYIDGAPLIHLDLPYAVGD